MAIYEEEVVSPLQKSENKWTYVPNDQIIAYLVKYPMSTVVTTYQGINATVSRRHGLYRLNIAGRTFTLNKCELRVFTMAK